MTRVAIIPARGGSKRIPKKNIKRFCGQPLIAYSIQAAKESGLFHKVIVNTDSEKIAEVARDYGAKVPFMRPKELGDDYTPAGVAVNHALKTLEEMGENYDFCCTIYATAPFLKPDVLKKSFETLQNSDAKYCFGATSFPYPFQRSFKLENGRCKMFFPKHFSSRSQDLDEAYHDAGQFYWNDLSKKSDKCMFDSHSIPFILPRYMVHDIDTPEDWEMAELVFKALLRQHSNRMTL